jgi:23S rRNA (pseudouridine1915-N3)-methyltransferase
LHAPEWYGGDRAWAAAPVKLRVVAQGKLKPPGLREVADDYLKRAQRHLEVAELEVRDTRALLRSVDRADLNVALAVDGEVLSSRQFASRLSQWLSQAPRVSMFIGAAEGLPESLMADMRYRFSLSALTLPHRLARVLLFEQLYRATTLWRGEPYARED